MDRTLTLSSAIEFRPSVPGVTVHVIPPVLVPPRMLAFSVIAQSTIKKRRGLLPFHANAHMAVDGGPAERLGYGGSGGTTTTEINFNHYLPDSVDLGQPHTFTITLFDGPDRESADTQFGTLTLSYTP